MELPKFDLSTRQDLFDIRLRRFVDERFPDLSLEVKVERAARHYTVRREDTAIAEIETLPYNDDRLEVRPYRLDPDDTDFCGKFYEWVGPEHGVKLPETCLVWVSGLVTHPAIERSANTHSEEPEMEAARCGLVEATRTGLPPVPDDGRKIGKRESGVTIKTQERAQQYKKLKSEHPDWSQAKLAMELNLRDNVDYHTETTVRTAYRAMGWEWERADRVR